MSSPLHLFEKISLGCDFVKLKEGCFSLHVARISPPLSVIDKYHTPGFVREIILEYDNIEQTPVEKSVIASNGIAMSGEISVIKVKGYLDVITSEELDAAIEELVSARRYNIVVDLNEVDYISSMGWGLFLSRINDLRVQGGDLKLARMQLNVYEVFKVLEFEWFLNTYPTLDAAALAFRLNGNGVSHSQHS